MNILIICIDALRARNLSCYGYPLKTTPFLDEFSHECILFENFYAPINVTDPSLTSLFTGCMPSRHGILNHGRFVTIPEKQAIKSCMWLPEVLLKEGYETIAIDWLGRWHKRGFQHYFSLSKNTSDLSLTEKLYKYALKIKEISPRLRFPSSLRYLYERFRHSTHEPGKVITEKAIKLIDKRKNKKWFLFLHYWDTHTPYKNRLPLLDATEEDYREIYDFEAAEKLLLKVLKRHYHKGSLLKLHHKGSLLKTVRAYDECIIYVDKQLETLIRYLRKEKILDDIIIIILSDHGESLVEHGIFFDHHGLYDVSLHTPLIIRFPSISPRRVDGLVQHIDIMPTLLEYLDINNHLNGFDGCSLIPLIKNKVKKIRDVIFFEEYHTQRKIGLRTNKYKYILDLEGKPCRYCHIFHGTSEELYDIKLDPEETKNLSSKKNTQTKDFKQICLKEFEDLKLKRLRRLKKFMKLLETDKPYERDYIEEKIIKERLKKLGYI